MRDPRYYKRRGSGDGGAPYSQMEQDEKELRESLSPWQRLWAFLNRPIRFFGPDLTDLVFRVPPAWEHPIPMPKLPPATRYNIPQLELEKGEPKIRGLDNWKPNGDITVPLNMFHSFTRANLPKLPTATQAHINALNDLATRSARGRRLLGLDEWEYSRG